LIANEPVSEYPRLFHQLRLPFTSEVEKQIEKTTSDKNPVELAKKNPHSIQVHSGNAIDNWRKRLLPEEIEKIQQITYPIAEKYYDPADWEPQQ
jgi:hypothetical protein